MPNDRTTTACACVLGPSGCRSTIRFYDLVDAHRFYCYLSYIVLQFVQRSCQAVSISSDPIPKSIFYEHHTIKGGLIMKHFTFTVYSMVMCFSILLGLSLAHIFIEEQVQPLARIRHDRSCCVCPDSSIVKMSCIWSSQFSASSKTGGLQMYTLCSGSIHIRSCFWDIVNQALILYMSQLPNVFSCWTNSLKGIQC